MNGPFVSTPRSIAHRCALLHQLWRFSVVGVVAFVVNAGLVELLVTMTGPVWAQCIAFPVAATVAWQLNRRYTFASSGLPPRQEWIRYILANGVGWLINNSTYLGLVLTVPLIADRPSLAVAAGSIAGLAINFLSSRHFVFNNHNSAP